MIGNCVFRQPQIPTSGSRLWLFGVAGLAALSSIAMATNALAANAGRTTAVIQDARGTPPGQTTRILRPKLDVFRDERIQTDERGVTQILLVDGSNLTVGPNSDLTIDRFVYNPNTSTGEIAAKLGRGVLRFVGGQISKRGKVRIETPTAVIGIRGGIAVIEHSAGSGTRSVFLFGDEMTVSGLLPDATETATRSVRRPGFSVTVSSEGGVSDARRADAEQLNKMLGSLEAKEGTKQKSAKAVTQSASAYTQEAETGDSGGPSLADRPIPAAVQNAEQDDTGQYRESTETPSPPALWTYHARSSNIRYQLPFMRTAGGRIHPLTIIKREGDSIDEGFHRYLRIRSRFSGTGAQQEAVVLLSTGRIVESYPGAGLLSFQGPVTGSARGPSVDIDGSPTSNDMYHVWSYIIEDPDRHPSPAFGGEVPPDTFYQAGPEFQGTLTPIYIRAHDDERNSPTVGVEWALDDSIQRMTHYGPRGDRDWRGYATGMFERHEGGAVTLYSLVNWNRSPRSVYIGTSADFNGIVADFGLGSPDPDGPGLQTPSTGPGGVNGMRIQFGRGRQWQLDLAQQSDPNIEFISGSRGTYLSDRVFAAISSVGLREIETGSFASVRRLIWVNGNIVPNRLDNRTWLYSNDASPAEGLLPPGVEFCDCPAVRFGWWGGRISFDGNRDDVFPGTFVVGLLPDIADIPASGTASYAGHAAAAINDGTSTYAAVGGFTMNWNFATRSGEAAVRNLDGRDYTASNLEAPVANPRDFHGTLTQTAGIDVANPASGPVDGSFFSDGGNTVRDTGGQFSVESSAGYRATGSFAATQ